MKPNESVSPTYEELEAKVWHLEAVLKSLTPRPIEEAPPTDPCNTILAFYNELKYPRCVHWAIDYSFKYRPSSWKSPEVGYMSDGDACIPTNQPTHFIPLSAIQALMESGE